MTFYSNVRPRRFGAGAPKRGPFDDASPSEATNVIGGQPCFRCGGLKREAATFPPYGRPADDPSLCQCPPGHDLGLVVHFPAPNEGPER